MGLIHFNHIKTINLLGFQNYIFEGTFSQPSFMLIII